LDEIAEDTWHTAPPGYAYAPPPEAAVLPAGSRYGPTAHLARPLDGLAWTAGLLLVGQALLALATAGVAGWMVLTYAGTSGGSLDTLLAPDWAVFWLLIVSGGLSLVTGPLFAGWLFRACRNLQLYGVRLRRGPGWAWGAWFIPVVSLWWPKQVVDDAVRGSRADVAAGLDVRALRRSGFVTAWWSCWLLSGVLSSMAALSGLMPVLEALRSSAAATDLAGVLAAVDVARLRETQALWTLGSATASCLAATFAVTIVVEVTREQRERRTGLAELFRG
jgi:hypothetical protein